MAIFIRDEEVWFSIIVDAKYQRQGFGQQLLNMAKLKQEKLNGWVVDNNESVKLDGTPYLSPLKFYLQNGFNVLQDIRFDTEKLSAVKIRWVSV